MAKESGPTNYTIIGCSEQSGVGVRDERFHRPPNEALSTRKRKAPQPDMELKGLNVNTPDALAEPCVA